RGDVGHTEERGQHGITPDAAQPGGAAEGLFGFKALSPEQPGPSFRESPRTPILCKQAGGKEAAPAAQFARDSFGRVPCVSTWCRYHSDRPRSEHHHCRRTIATQRPKDNARTVCARCSSIAKRRC